MWGGGACSHISHKYNAEKYEMIQNGGKSGTEVLDITKEGMEYEIF